MVGNRSKTERCSGAWSCEELWGMCASVSVSVCLRVCSLSLRSRMALMGLGLIVTHLWANR